ncbi:MAG: hypothetical protein KAJ52_10275 [Sedimentisphaerales bacterium]|nr:hypothetical protein [Sedimentisphaerales bacterium]
MTAIEQSIETPAGSVFDPRVRLSVIIVVLLPMALLVAGLGCDDRKQPGNRERTFEIDRKFERGPLTVHVKVQKEKITIADTLWVRLEATIDEGYEVTMPAVAEFLDKEKRFGILDYESPPDKLAEDNRLLVQREYRLEPILSGQYAIPAMKFVFRKKTPTQPADNAKPEDKRSDEDQEISRQNEHEFFTEEIPIEVTSLLDEQRDDLTIADIKDVTVLPRRFPTWWLWVLGGTGLVSGAAVIFILLHKRKKKKQLRIMKAAHEIAYERLQKLAGDNLIEAGKIREFYERISHILRSYIEHRFDLKAPERTTEEFLIEAQAAGLLTSDQKTMLRGFLEHCDMVKFARYGPTKTEIQKTFDLTKEFIEATRIAEKQVDVTEQDEQQKTLMTRNA